ncbi:hypothetical protein DOY81_011555 [Sarcophaga bullata]|nr:hypothetical protein DOY81_011555 [Sarcophaga bullata]
MSASKKYKSSETATEIIHQQDTENINSNRFRKSADYFGPSTSAAAAAAQQQLKQINPGLEDVLLWVNRI